MATRQLAQGLAGLGRHGDSMLMHVSPAEVAGLQHLGSLHGTSLTTNPHTGLPEAFSFGKFLKAAAPTVAGILAAPATGGMSMAPILAGAGTGAAIAAASGDNIGMGAIGGGLGGWGGGNIGAGLANMGGAGTSAGTGVGEVGLHSGVQNVAPEMIASGTPEGLTPFAAGDGSQAFAGAGADSGAGAGIGSGATPTFESMGQGLKNIGQEGSWDAFKAGMGPKTTDMQAGMSLGLPAMSAYSAGAAPAPYEEDPYDPKATLNLGSDTGLNLNKDTGLRLLASGGLATLNGTPDGTQAQNTLNENYGLGRLNNLSNASSMEQAKFNSNGYAAPAQQPYGGAQYNPQTPPQPQPMGQSTQGQPPMGQMQQPQMGQVQQMGGFGGFNSMGPQNAFTPQPRFAQGGLADGGFVVPADVVSHLGNGSTDAGLKHLQTRMGARPIRGAGDGMSDSIKTTIDGKQPARIADGEAYIPPEAVQQRGGAKNLYNMMNKVRKSRTGSTKQGKQINPNSFLPK